jgi:hypothetical protein
MTKIYERFKFVASLLLACTSTFPLAGCGSEKVKASDNSELNNEQRAVYVAFLDAIASVGFKNLASTTTAFDPSDLPRTNPCLKRTPEASFSGASSGGVYIIDASLVVGRNIAIVDPQQQVALKESADRSKTQAPDSKASLDGFLVLSEIAFDKAHRFALLKYNFICGTHCSTSQTYLMAKTDNQWHVSGRPCTMVVN